MSPETLSSRAALQLSLAFSYVPGFASRYDDLDGVRKSLVMLAGLVLVYLGCE